MIATEPTLTAYLQAAMAQSYTEPVEESDMFVGRIPGCVGLMGFGHSAEAALADLRYALEDWVILGLRFGDLLPVFDGIDLNRAGSVEPLDSL